MIDELHSFIGTERGAHLRSLICRLAAKSREPVRRAGLSATFGRGDRSSLPLAAAITSRGRADHRRPREEIHPVEDLGLSAAIPVPRTSGEQDESENDDARRSTAISRRDVFETFHGKTALIFTNAKSDIEKIADYARRESARRGLPDLFRVHHGSLSKGEREETEEALKSAQPTATFCSSTLEMGIDVGNVKLVGQIGPPGR